MKDDAIKVWKITYDEVHRLPNSSYVAMCQGLIKYVVARTEWQAKEAIAVEVFSSGTVEIRSIELLGTAIIAN